MKGTAALARTNPGVTVSLSYTTMTWRPSAVSIRITNGRLYWVARRHAEPRVMCSHVKLRGLRFDPLHPRPSQRTQRKAGYSTRHDLPDCQPTWGHLVYFRRASPSPHMPPPEDVPGHVDLKEILMLTITWRSISSVSIAEAAGFNLSARHMLQHERTSERQTRRTS